jgi:hypothetical protein
MNLHPIQCGGIVSGDAGQLALGHNTPIDANAQQFNPIKR